MCKTSFFHLKKAARLKPSLSQDNKKHMISWILNKFTWHCPSSPCDYLERIDYCCIYAKSSVVIKHDRVVWQEKSLLFNRTGPFVWRQVVWHTVLAFVLDRCETWFATAPWCRLQQPQSWSQLTSVWKSALLDAGCNKKLSAETQGDH